MTPETLDYDSNGVVNKTRAYLPGDIASEARLVQMQRAIEEWETGQKGEGSL